MQAEEARTSHALVRAASRAGATAAPGAAVAGIP
jgi:hypothetical protein